MRSCDRLLLCLAAALFFSWLMLRMLVLAHSEEDHTSSATPCLHIVPAVALRTIDGDTFVVRVQIWPHQYWEGSVRLRGINAPETHSKCQEERDAAAQATTALKEILRADQQILLCNPQEDVYPGRVDATVLLPGGRTVSGLLLDQGVVRPYDGKGKRPPWCMEGQ